MMCRGFCPSLLLISLDLGFSGGTDTMSLSIHRHAGPGTASYGRKALDRCCERLSLAGVTRLFRLLRWQGFAVNRHKVPSSSRGLFFQHGRIWGS